MKIILATTSPYRRMLMDVLGIEYESIGSNVDESVVKRNEPGNLVRELSRLKAQAVADNNPDSLVIGMDSIGWFNGSPLEKPKSREDAYNRLKSLSGNNYSFYTGICMINTKTGDVFSRVVKTDIEMRTISESEINKYLDQDPNFITYAHGYDPQNHLSTSFVKKIEGSHNNFIWGFPLEVVVEMLKEQGVKL